MSAAQSIVEAKNETPSAIATWVAPVWNAERRALARKAVCPPTATEAEFEFFMAWCERTGLDPFIKQAYLIERSAEVNGQWVKKHEPMAAEAGMGARADAEADFAGIKAATVWAGDKFSVDEDAQKVSHVWDLESRTKAGLKVVGAWAHAMRHSRITPIIWLPIESRIALKRDGKPTQFWAKDPGGQILKCARAAAFRQAFKNIFAGVYAREELGDVIDGEATEMRPANATPPTASRVEQVAAKVAAKVAQQTPTAKKLDARCELIAGPMKGAAISGLSAEELADAVLLFESKIREAVPSSTWLPEVKTCLEALQGEQEKRMAEIGGEA